MFYPRSQNRARKSNIFPSSLEKSQADKNSEIETTPRRRPIFSEEKSKTPQKTIHPTIKSSLKKEEKRQQSNQNSLGRQDLVAMFRTMLNKVNDKNELLKLTVAENEALQRENEKLLEESNKIVKKIAVYKDVGNLRRKNGEYRAKLLRAQALLIQLKLSTETSIFGIDDIIQHLHI